MQRSPRKNTVTPAARACVNCQKRKSRCLQETKNGPCSFCERKGKTCSFEGPPARTSLTRKNLDAAERRCTQLRALLQSLNPDLDVESALEILADDTDSCHINEVNETTPDSYEWHEGSLSPDCDLSRRVNTISTDGMATLSTTDSGYLGR